MVWLVLLLSLCVVSPVVAATRYVDSTTTGCSNGSTTYDPATEACGSGSSTVYTSITNALAANTTVAGDTLYIKAGTYAQSINSNTHTIPTGTSYVNAPIIAAAPGETVTITGSINLPHTSIQYVIFKDFHLTGAVPLNVGLGSGTTGPNHVKFDNVEIANGTHQCVFIVGNDNWFTGGSVHHCGLAENVSIAGYNFYVSGNNNLIEHVEISHVQGYGIHTWLETGSPSGNIYRYNYLHDTSTAGGSWAAILLAKGANNMAYSNSIAGNNRRGILIFGPSGQLVYNNVIYGGNGEGIRIASGSTSSVRNNISTNNSGGSVVDSTGVATVTHNACLATESCGTTGKLTITAVTNCTTGTTGPFTQKTGSSCIDQGINVGQAFTGSAPEIGPEATALPDTTPPSAPTGVTVQ